ncbi:HAD family phosphatase [Anaerotruncus colihominis]|uniref:HAD family phosphatase n=2 Tax=Oscillospiraceae TaxID=216572 RepID=A0A845SX67_9FIRM|nr:HAD family phosphatase [Anaerotruncus colihominis]
MRPSSQTRSHAPCCALPAVKYNPKIRLHAQAIAQGQPLRSLRGRPVIIGRHHKKALNQIVSIQRKFIRNPAEAFDTKTFQLKRFIRIFIRLVIQNFFKAVQMAGSQVYSRKRQALSGLLAAKRQRNRQSRLPCAYCIRIRLTRQFTAFPSIFAALAALYDWHYNRDNNAQRERTGIDCMSIKLIALDMDGTTLCSDHHTISQENLDAMASAAAQGILIVPATGRICNRLPEMIEDQPWLRYVVTVNGAAVTDLHTGESLYKNPLERTVALQVFDLVEPYPIFIEIYCDGFDYIEERRMPYFAELPISEDRRNMMLRGRRFVVSQRAFLEETDGAIEKFNLPYLEDDLRLTIWKQLAALDGVTLTSSIAKNIEINAAGADKGDSLAHLCAHLGIAPDEVLAIGDGENDLTMLQFSGTSVAPANACEQARAIADWVSPSNDESAVARTLEHYHIL